MVTGEPAQGTGGADGRRLDCPGDGAQRSRPRRGPGQVAVGSKRRQPCTTHLRTSSCNGRIPLRAPGPRVRAAWLILTLDRDEPVPSPKQPPTALAPVRSTGQSSVALMARYRRALALDDVARSSPYGTHVVDEDIESPRSPPGYLPSEVAAAHQVGEDGDLSADPRTILVVREGGTRPLDRRSQ